MIILELGLFTEERVCAVHKHYTAIFFYTATGRLHKQKLCQLAENVCGTAGYVIVAPHFLFSMLESMIGMMLVNLLVFRSYKHMSDVTNILLIFFYLVLNLSKFLTRKQRIY